MMGVDEPGFGDTVEGEPGEGRRLVPIGHGVWAWVDAGAVAEWDERNWRPIGGAS